MLTNVPNSIRGWRQWIVWRYEVRQGSDVPTKVPYQALMGRLASVTEPSHWATFDDACAALQNGGYNGVGFVFTANDPFVGIDLDYTDDADLYKAHGEIYTAIQSYSEWSPSGKGIHIIAAGQVPAGIRFGKVEVYSDQRYFTFTGNVTSDRAGWEIADCAELVSQLYIDMRNKQGGQSLNGAANDGELFERIDDGELYRQASQAANGDKFTALWEGRWQDVTDDYGRAYPSQSEADQALVNILQFYSQNKLQIERMFLQSNLARQKHHDRNKLVQYMVTKSFDREPPPMNFDKLISDANAQRAEHERRKLDAIAADVQQAPPRPEDDVYTIPPDCGFLGAIAQFIYDSAPRPVPEIALAAALGLMAGIAGNAFNVGGAGLNMYLMVMAPTGVGKEAINLGISKIIATMKRHSVGAIENFRGPGEIASAAALFKCFKTSTSIFSIMSEFGYRLAAMTDMKQSQQVQLKRALLEIYAKSGAGSTMGSMAYSDTARNQESINSPALTIITESTPEILLANLTEQMISDGLLPRFLVIDYKGFRVPLNEHAHNVEMSEQFRGILSQFATACLSMMERRIHTDVQFDDEALKLDRQFDKFCDAKINSSKKDAIRQLWTRAHVKVRKIAALCAVGKNFMAPEITAAHYVWAKAIVVHDVASTVARFDKGDIGKSLQETSHQEMVKTTASHLVEYLDRDFDNDPYNGNYRVSKDHRDCLIIPKRFLHLKANQARPYRQAKFKSIGDNLNIILREMVGLGWLQECSHSDPAYVARFGVTIKQSKNAEMFWIVDTNALRRLSEGLDE